MIKISSLTLIPMMFCGILLFSFPAFSQDRSDQTQITRSDYISMDKQVSILEFKVKELEKNSDNIDALKSDILSNKADIQFLYKIFLSWYFIVALMIGFISIGIGIFAYNKTKSMAAKQCEKWLKDHKKEILKSLEKPTKSWLTENKDEVLQKIKDIPLIDSIPSIDLKNNQDFNSTILHESEEGKKATELFEKAMNGHGVEKISAYSKLIDQFNNNEHEEILLLVARAYGNLALALKGQDGIDTYRELINQFKNSQNQEILIRVANTYWNLALSLEGQEEIDTYRQLIDQFKNSQNQEILIRVANTYWNLALSLEGQDQIDTYRELINQFKNSENEEILLRVAMAYVNLANKLIDTNQRSEAIQLLSEAIKQFKNSDNQELTYDLQKWNSSITPCLRIVNSNMKKTNIFLRILGYSSSAILFILDVIISNIELIIYLVGAGIFIYLIYILTPLIIATLCLYYAYLSLIAFIIFIVGIIMAFLFFIGS